MLYCDVAVLVHVGIRYLPRGQLATVIAKFLILICVVASVECWHACLSAHAV
jgi:hypothetical protein